MACVIDSWNHVQDGIIGITFNGFLRRLFRYSIECLEKINTLFVCSDLDEGELLKTLLQPDDDRVEFKTFNSIISMYLKSKQT